MSKFSSGLKKAKNKVKKAVGTKAYNVTKSTATLGQAGQIVSIGTGGRDVLGDLTAGAPQVDISPAKAAIQAAIANEIKRFGEYEKAGAPFVAMAGAAHNFLQDPQNNLETYRQAEQNDRAQNFGAGLGAVGKSKTQDALAERRGERDAGIFNDERFAKNAGLASVGIEALNRVPGSNIAQTASQGAATIAGLQGQVAQQRQDALSNTISGAATIGGLTYLNSIQPRGAAVATNAAAAGVGQAAGGGGAARGSGSAAALLQ